MDKKTSAYIETVDVGNVVFPQTTIVRPPANLKVVRCTVIFQNQKVDIESTGYLSTGSEQNTLNTILFQNFSLTDTLLPPGRDRTITGINSFVFDRLGVGYMVDNFYVSSEGDLGSRFIFVWEGIIQST